MTARRPYPLVLALPLLLGLGLQPGTCGSILDYNTIDIVLEPVTLVDIDNEEGSITTLTFARNGVRLAQHTYGFQASLGRQEHWVDGDAMFALFNCKAPADCSTDFNLELPSGTALAVHQGLGDIEVGAHDADLRVELDVGAVIGLELASPTVTITAGESAVDLAFAVAPQTVDITVSDGAVELELPAATPYRCTFTLDDGEQTLDGLVCDDTAAAALTIDITHGDLTIRAI